MPDLRKLAEIYLPHFSFYVIYIAEAHAAVRRLHHQTSSSHKTIQDEWPVGRDISKFKQTKSTAERCSNALYTCDVIDIPIPTYVAALNDVRI